MHRSNGQVAGRDELGALKAGKKLRGASRKHLYPDTFNEKGVESEEYHIRSGPGSKLSVCISDLSRLPTSHLLCLSLIIISLGFTP